MAFIKIFNFEESSGLLKKEYEKECESWKDLENSKYPISNTSNTSRLNEVVCSTMFGIKN